MRSQARRGPFGARAFARFLTSPYVTLAIIVALAFAVRIAFLVNHEGLWGVDGGAYLLSRNTVLGDEPTGTDFPRPPFAPGWLLVPFTAWLGDGAGIRAFALAASIPMVPAFWLVARRYLTAWQTVAATGLVLADWMLAEMFVAGDLPMIGFSFLFLAFWAMQKIQDGPPARIPVAVLALTIPAMAFTNQTTAAIAGLVLTVTFVGMVIQRRVPLSQGWAQVIVLAAGAGFALAMLALPWYLEVAPGSDYTRYGGPLITHYPPQNAAWFQLGLGLAAAACTLRWGAPALKFWAAPLLLLATLAPIVSYDEAVMNITYRSRYLIEIPLILTGVWLAANRLLPAIRRSEFGRLAYVYAGAFAVMVSFGYVYQIHAETKLGRMVSAETVDALGWITARNDPEVAILTNSYSLSLFVAGMTKTPTAWTQVYDPPRAYQKQHADALCLFGWVPGCDAALARTDLNVRFLLAERDWPAYGAEIPEHFRDLGPAFGAVKALSPWPNSNVGKIWQAPRQPWAITNKTPWLRIVWEGGPATVWEVIA